MKNINLNQQKLSLADLKLLAAEVAKAIPNLNLLILFGSRARGNHHTDSDWDFAIIYDPKYPQISYQDAWGWLKIKQSLETVFNIPEDKIDVVDLGQCSPWLAHSIAQDGQVIFEKTSGEFEQFRQKTIKSNTELKIYQQTVREKVRSALKRWKNESI
jgi:predicted nucleotidyltransferase